MRLKKKVYLIVSDAYIDREMQKKERECCISHLLVYSMRTVKLGDHHQLDNFLSIFQNIDLLGIITSIWNQGWFVVFTFIGAFSLPFNVKDKEDSASPFCLFVFFFFSGTFLSLNAVIMSASHNPSHHLSTCAWLSQSPVSEWPSWLWSDDTLVHI